MRHWDVIVVGAGPAGSRAAELIARRGIQRAVVLVDPAVIGIDDIVRGFKSEGLDLRGTVARWHLRIAGLACDRCARRIEEAVTQLPGVRAAFVNRATESLTVELVVGQTDIGGIRTALLGEGCDPGPSPRPRIAVAEGLLGRATPRPRTPGETHAEPV